VTAGLPLDGFRVVDLTASGPDGLGALCGRILADLGADVVLVEPPGGASGRRRAPFAPDGTSLWFAHRTVNERSVVLGLHTEDGRVDFETLVAGADALIESSGPGGLAAIDVSVAPRGLAAAYPHLVVCSISHFGADGPHADWSGTDLVDAAAGNMAYRFGPRHRAPLAPPGSMASDSAGIAAAVAVLAAWHQALGNGHGQWLDVSAVEAMANLGDWSLPMFSALGRDQVRDGAGTLYPIYRCADGHLRMVTPLTGREWTALVEWLGHPDSVSGDEWIQPAYRMARLAELRDVLAKFFADKPRDATVADGIARGLAIAPVLQPGEVLDHPHFVSRHTFTDVEVAPGTTARLVDGFASIDGVRAGVRTAPPALPSASGLAAAAIDPWPARPTPDESFGLGTRPFAGIRVLDFGIGGVGVECSRLLALLGADVVKIESSANPDFQRVVLGGQMNGAFASSSRSKRALGVSLTDPEGVKLVHRLASVADVVVENRGTGALDRLGVGWDALHAVNPRLVMVSSQLMGDRGTWSDWKGYGPITRAVSGLAWLWNHPEDLDDPQGVTTIHPDHQAGRWMAVLTAALLLRRARTGEGGRADVAQVEVIVGQLGDLLAAESVTPGCVRPTGNEGPDAPWGVFRCADLTDEGLAPGVEEDWIAVSVRDDADWARLAEVVGAPEWRDPGLAARAARQARHAELDSRLGLWTATQTALDAATRLQAAGVPAARLVHPRTLPEDEHERSRDFIVSLEQPGVGPMRFEGPPFRGPSLGPPIETPAPWPGEHTREVCREWLALPDAEIDALLASGALEQYTP
jgi:crotonobetainyl-CoA:carnitine CoA-transferase CaiB-like acyl-CoA transferase